MHMGACGNAASHVHVSMLSCYYNEKCLNFSAHKIEVSSYLEHIHGPVFKGFPDFLFCDQFRILSHQGVHPAVDLCGSVIIQTDVE